MSEEIDKELDKANTIMLFYEERIEKLESRVCDIVTLKEEIKKTNGAIEENNKSLGNIRESIVGINAFMTNINTMFLFIKEKVTSIERLPTEYIKHVDKVIDEKVDLKVYKYVFRAIAWGLPSTGVIVTSVWWLFKIVSKYFS